MEKADIKSYSDIGREYRSDYRRNRIKGIIFQSIVSLLIIAAFSILALFFLGIVVVTKAEFYMVCFVVAACDLEICATFTALIILRVILRNKQLRNTDEWLGKKYARSYKRIKGCARRKVKPLLIALPIISAVLLFFNLAVVRDSYVIKPIEQYNLVEVAGEVAYFDVSKMKKSEIYYFGLKNNTTLYKISDDSYYACDNSIKDEIKIGDYVYLSYDRTAKASKAYENGYDNLLEIYSFRSTTKTYLTYEQYIAEFKDDKKIVATIYFANYSISGLAFLGLQVALIYLIVRTKKEDIYYTDLLKF